MRRSILFQAMVVGLAVSAVSGGARADAGAVARCAAIDNDARRLECYDAASGRSRPSPPAASSQPAPAGPRSLIGEAWALDPGPDDPEFKLASHRANYLLLVRHSDNPNSRPFSPLPQALGLVPESIDPNEMKFQVSFKTRLWRSESRRWGLWAAYTQQNHWQTYNSEVSRPFRETNYSPELIASYRADQDLGPFRWRALNLGLIHHSNGRGGALSRSWNRVYAEFGLERENLGLLIRPWYRIPESAEKDDNPDISDYYGYGDVTAVYKTARGHTLSLMARANPRTGKGAAQLSWSTPRLLGRFRGYLQIFSGYGESLIDYNWRQTTIGLGVALNDDL